MFPILKDLKSKQRSVLTNTHVKRIVLSGNIRVQTRFEENHSIDELPDNSL